MNSEAASKPLRVAPIWLRDARSSRGIDSAWLKELARESGLEVAAIAGPESFRGLDDHIQERIEQGHFAGFDWFTPERATVSATPANLHDGIRSIVSVGLPYYRAMPELPDDDRPRGRIARYAWGADYHVVLKRRMADLLAHLEQRAGRTIEARLLVDTARTVDRAIAGRSGLGWYGKHTCIIVPGYGSWVLLGELMLDLDLEPDAPLDRNCGKCRACLDNCPTGAIVAPYAVDSTRCISFQTIEQRGVIPMELRPQFGSWVFGCDVCQEVCPYTSAAQESADQELAPKTLRNVGPELDWLLAVSDDEFRATYRGTAVLRAKRRGLARNAAVALGNSRSPAAIEPLSVALGTHDEPLVRGHAAWAIGHVGTPEAFSELTRAHEWEVDDYVRSEIRAALDRESAAE